MRDHNTPLHAKEDRAADALIIKLRSNARDRRSHQKRSDRTERQPAEFRTEHVGDRSGDPFNEFD